MKSLWRRYFWILLGTFLITSTLKPQFYSAFAYAREDQPLEKLDIQSKSEFECFKTPKETPLGITEEEELGRILTNGNNNNKNDDSTQKLDPFPITVKGNGNKSHNGKNKENDTIQTYHLTQEAGEKEIVNSYLKGIHSITTGSYICPEGEYKILTRIPISVDNFQLPKEKADLVAFFMPRITRKVSQQQQHQEIKNILISFNTFQHFHQEQEEFKTNIEGVRFIEYPTPYYQHVTVYDLDLRTNSVNQRSLQEDYALTFPWYFNAIGTLANPNSIDLSKFDANKTSLTTRINSDTIGYWTWPYFRCKIPGPNGSSGELQGHWLISYTVAFRGESRSQYHGLLSFDIDLTNYPINQCDEPVLESKKDRKSSPLAVFHGTHKCDNKTTICEYDNNQKLQGWYVGNYVCKCKELHYAYKKEWNNSASGLYIESNWWCFNTEFNNKTRESENEFQNIRSCQPCLEGCPDCTEKKSCMAQVNYPFRLTILCISIVCSIGALGLIIGVYKCRKCPIFSASSPIFLCITLFGCSIMYTEMIVLYPTLSMHACIAVKWTRHLGFCITYTALYMKLCRVYLTFRVKSAHKIKLTEKHLLHWMSPIMVIMLLYLFAWTISDPPKLEVMKTNDDLRLYQCVYNWWDHVLSVGEIIFLAYGVFICWRIRENHDARFISYSIYNIALVNVIMVTLHLNIIPKSGPDMKYMLAFVRTQMSTTITILLVLGSKIYRAYRGDLPTMKEIANSANGFGHDVLDLDEENMQLKEELQKMAMQMERLKSYAMCKNNPHLKPSSIANATANISLVDIDYGKNESTL